MFSFSQLGYGLNYTKEITTYIKMNKTEGVTLNNFIIKHTVQISLLMLYLGRYQVQSVLESFE
jgi:hypothetical protein